MIKMISTAFAAICLSSGMAWGQVETISEIGYPTKFECLENRECALRHTNFHIENCISKSQRGEMDKTCIGDGAQACAIASRWLFKDHIAGCAILASESWKGKMFEAYAALNETVENLDQSERERSGFDGKSHERSQALKLSQVAWQAYVKQQCDFEHKYHGLGTMRRTASAQCRLNNTAERTLWLMYKNYWANH